MNSRANRLAKPRASRTPPSAFRPVSVSESSIEVLEVMDAGEALPRFASLPDAAQYVPSFSASYDQVSVQAAAYDDAFEETLHKQNARDNSFDETLRRPSKTKKAERVAAARANRLFDAPFAHQVAATPPATFAARPVAPLARARQTVPPAAPSSTGSLLPVTVSAEDSGYHASVGGPTMLVPRASISNETNRGVPAWLYSGVAAAVLLAGGLFAIGGRTQTAQAAGSQPQVAVVDAPKNVQYAPVAPAAHAPAPVAVNPSAIDPVLAAALATPATASPAEAVRSVPSDAAPAHDQGVAHTTGKPSQRFASAHGTRPVPAALPVQVAHAPRAIAAPSQPAAAAAPGEGGHDVRTSQQTFAAASKVIGDSL